MAWVHVPEWEGDCSCWAWAGGKGGRWGDTIGSAIWASLVATAVNYLSLSACCSLLFEPCLREVSAVVCPGGDPQLLTLLLVN